MKNNLIGRLTKIIFALWLPCALAAGLSLVARSGQAVHYAASTAGYILLQVEKNGEAFYVYPKDGQRYFLGRPAEAFAIMKKLCLGAKHDYLSQTETFPLNLSGLILLDVEANGEAYYIYPGDLKKYYLGRPDDAFRIMRNLGLGITNNDLSPIPLGDINKTTANLPAGNYLINNVPFTSQAPKGDWSDSRQQNGCEEASVMMAMRWINGQNLTADEALKEIVTLADWQEKNYGESRDTSAQDTLDRLIKTYYGYERAELKKNVSLNDMAAELKAGNLLIVPMNGQIMHNPFFRAPGPPRHMVVVLGYDAAKKIFITNDPGTRNGRLYQYDLQVFYEAMRDYPTGYHELINQIEKNVIVVSK